MVCTAILILLTYKAHAFIFLLSALHGHISWDQFLISMVSLVMSIGKKQHVLLKAWARVFNAILIIILHVTMLTCTTKL